MATNAKKWSTGAVVVGGLGALALGWLVFGGVKATEAALTPTPPGPPAKPPSTYVPDPETPPPAPLPPTLVADWCSAMPSAGPPPMLDPEVSAYVRANTDQAVLYLWLMLSLYVTRYDDFLPTVDRLRDSVDRTNGFDPDTEKAIRSLLPGREGLEIPKGRTIIDAYRAFAARDPSRDRPCPVSVPADLDTLLADSFQETKRLADSGV